MYFRDVKILSLFQQNHQDYIFLSKHYFNSFFADQKSWEEIIKGTARYPLEFIMCEYLEEHDQAKTIIWE
jgi:hypothetical protein